MASSNRLIREIEDYNNPPSIPRQNRNNSPSIRRRRLNNNAIGDDSTKRKSPRVNQVIDLNSSDDSPNNSQRTPTNNLQRAQGGRRRKNRKKIEIINIDSDTSPPATPHKRRKSSDDDEIIQVYSPPRAARPQQSTSAASSTAVDRIREVFPTLSRSKVTSFLQMGSSYAQDDVLVSLVMTVLAEDPTGESITEKSFAIAAVVGGRIDKSAGGAKVAQLECNCCYVEYDYEEMISCKAGHLFCKTCLQKHVETRVFGVGNFGVKKGKRAWEILCMCSEGCGEGFYEGSLRGALSEKVMKKYDELQYQAVVEGFKDTSKCPKCDYIAFAEESVSTFHCPQCNFKSCRECGEESHPGIRCDEVETKHETSGRNKVEEAMTNAVIRKCPRPMCRKPFMKTDGCNKITCSCGAFICYICRQEIPKNVAYQHFCQTPHCNHRSCNKCGLYADAESADKIAVEKAAKDAAKSVSTGRKGVTVNVEQIMQNPQQNPARQGNHHRNQRPRNVMQTGGRRAPNHPQPNFHIPQQIFLPPQQNYVPFPNHHFAQPPPPQMHHFPHQQQFGYNAGGPYNAHNNGGWQRRNR